MAGLDALGFRPILPVVFIPAKFVYLVAALCGLYGSVAPFLSNTHSPITFFRVALWIGTALLLLAALLPTKYSNIDLAIRDTYRVVSTPTVLALLGSTATTALLFYGVARFVAFRLGYVHGMFRVAAYHPNAFDRVNQILTKPILLLFLISSVASLLVSAVITFRLRNRTASPPLTEGSGNR